ncbi:MAG: hypothetical protein KGL74_13630 [Elusimicrobia bacterium]|nr:hypothetical protein [Elusimicrobiota bacterium]MDE2512160.1 hypothetical protein [Elusimicrobiota bacterium]
MNPFLLALALAAVPARAQGWNAAPGGKTYGILLLAYDVDVKWRQELGNLRSQLKGHAVESVDSAGDSISVQRALDRLTAQHVSKVVAIPLETVGSSTRMEATRYMFGVRADPVMDVPGSGSGDFADKKPKALHSVRKSALVLPKDQDRGLSLAAGGDGSTGKQLTSPVPLVLAPTFDKSPLLVAILADRAKALTPTPGRESLVLVGVAPRSDDALAKWKTDAQAIADAVGAKAGYRKAVAVGVRDGVRSDQQDKDRAAMQTLFRGLIREGRVAVVPLSPEAERAGQLLKKTLGGFFAYRWNGQGIQGDRRMLDWIKASAEAAGGLPDGRQFNDGARGALGGKR